MRNWTAALAVLLLAVGLAPAAGAGDEEGVKAIAPAWAEAWNAGDMDAVAALYAEGADYVNFFGDTFNGVPAIQAAFAEINSTVYKDSKIEIETVAVSFIKPDVAITDSEWKLTGIPAGAPPLPTAGQSTVVVVKVGDAWKIAAHRARVPQPTGE